MSSSRETNDDTQFHPADYCVFAASLALSAGIGVYYGLCGDKKKKDDDDDDAKADEKKGADDDGGMSPLPVSFSVLASFLAAPFVLGTPAEMYVYGTMYSLVVIGFGLAVPFVSHMIIPVFHKLKITSGYQVSGGDNDVTVISGTNGCVIRHHISGSQFMQITISSRQTVGTGQLQINTVKLMFSKPNDDEMNSHEKRRFCE